MSLISFRQAQVFKIAPKCWLLINGEREPWNMKKANRKVLAWKVFRLRRGDSGSIHHVVCTDLITNVDGSDLWVVNSFALLFFILLYCISLFLKRKHKIQYIYGECNCLEKVPLNEIGGSESMNLVGNNMIARSKLKVDTHNTMASSFV